MSKGDGGGGAGGGSGGGGASFDASGPSQNQNVAGWKTDERGLTVEMKPGAPLPTQHQPWGFVDPQLSNGVPDTLKIGATKTGQPIATKVDQHPGLRKALEKRVEYKAKAREHERLQDAVRQAAERHRTAGEQFGKASPEATFRSRGQAVTAEDKARADLRRFERQNPGIRRK